MKRADYIYEHAATVEEVRRMLKKWPQQQYAKYCLGYFGFHGSPGTLHIGRQKIALEEFGDLLKGKCKGKTVYFGSCSVLDVPRAEIMAFKKATGASWVAGYTTDVDWFESAAWDLLLFDSLMKYKNAGWAKKDLKKRYPQMVRKLGFKMV